MLPLPTEIAVQFVAVPTLVGVVSGVALVEPAWPWSRRPQQYAVWSVRTAHTGPAPTLTWAQTVPPAIATGVGGGSVLTALPSWPYWLLPQHWSAPVVRTPHEVMSPAETDAQVVPVPTWIGEEFVN